MSPQKSNYIRFQGMDYLRAALIGLPVGLIAVFSPAWLLVGLLFFISLYLIKKHLRSKSRNFLVTIFIIGFALRVILSFINYHVGFMTGVKGPDTQPDAVTYNNHAFYISYVLKGGALHNEKYQKDPYLVKAINHESNEFNGRIPPIGHYQYGFYVYLLGLIYTIFGYAPIAAKAINGLFGCLSSIMVYYIARMLTGSERTSKIAALGTMFFPSLVYWSATLLRDPIANFLFLVYIVLLLAYIKKDKKYILILSFLAALALALFKEKIVLILLLGCLFTFVLQFFRELRMKKVITRWLIIGAISIITIALGLIYREVIANVVYHFVSSIFISHKLAARDLVSYSTYTLYKSTLYTQPTFDMRNILDISLPFSIVKALAYYFLSPFPWKVSYAHPLLIFFYPQVIFTFIISPAMLFGIFALFRKDIFTGVALIVLLSLVIIPQAMAEAIIGTVVRHRDMFTPFLIIFASYGFSLSVFPPENDKEGSLS